jgi:hypothetical protein
MKEMIEKKTRTLKLNISMNEANTVHPPYSTADFTPYALEDALAELGPCSVGVDEGEEVAAGEVGKDEDVVCWGGEVSEEGCYVWVGYVLEDRMGVEDRVSDVIHTVSGEREKDGTRPRAYHDRIPGPDHAISSAGRWQPRQAFFRDPELTNPTRFSLRDNYIESQPKKELVFLILPIPSMITIKTQNI